MVWKHKNEFPLICLFLLLFATTGQFTFAVHPAQYPQHLEDSRSDGGEKEKSCATLKA